jgi:hypothetical protein
LELGLDNPVGAYWHAEQAVALHTESEAPLLLAKAQEILDRIG